MKVDLDEKCDYILSAFTQLVPTVKLLPYAQTKEDLAQP